MAGHSDRNVFILICTNRLAKATCVLITDFLFVFLLSTITTTTTTTTTTTAATTLTTKYFYFYIVRGT